MGEFCCVRNGVIWAMFITLYACTMFSWPSLPIPLYDCLC